MTFKAVKFNRNDRPEFYKALRVKVNRYFKENNISRFANFNMVFKTIFMICLYFVPLVLLLSGVIQSFWTMLLMWALMGFGMSGIGLSIMHDANHGSYSRNKHVNKFLGYLINIIGGYHTNWKIQHNVLHHSFTNVEGFDEDIEIGIMRFSPGQKRKKIHKFQMIYAPILYGLMTLYWLTVKDFESVVRYRNKKLLAGQGTTFGKVLTGVIIVKIIYALVLLVLPLLLIPLPWWQILIGFFLMHGICGLLLALIFQPAHVIQETDFYEIDNTGSVENNWAIHQLRTTANFAQRSIFFSWFIGGLNYQIEHHLFPNICHVHYRKISKIVRETAKEFGMPYYQHRTFLSALTSHFKLLYQLGTGKYDRLLANRV